MPYIVELAAPDRVGAAIMRIVSDEDGQVTFRIKDYRNGGVPTTVTIPGKEFVSRFSCHILPRRFRRVRYAGWLGNNEWDNNLATARRALPVIVANEALEEENREDQDESQKVDIEDLLEDLAAERFRCPECGKVAVRWVWRIEGDDGLAPVSGRGTADCRNTADV